MIVIDKKSETEQKMTYNWLGKNHNNLKQRILKKLIILFSIFLICSEIFSVVSKDSKIDAENFIKNPNLPLDSIATSDDITSLYINPAGLGVHPLQIGYFFGRNQKKDLYDHTVFLNFLGIAFSSQWRLAPSDLSSQKYTVGTSLGNTKYISIGTSYSWFSSNVDSLDNFSQWDIGFLLRPFRALSIGFVGRSLNKPLFREQESRPFWDLGLGFRPLMFGFLRKYQEQLTFSVDSTWQVDRAAKDLVARYYLELVPFSGVTLYGGIQKDINSYFGMKFSQNISQISFQANTPPDGDNFYSGGILIGQERFKSSGEALKSFLVIKLETPFDEVKKDGSLFTSTNLTFYEYLKTINTAATDSQIEGIVLTGRNFTGGWGQAEELRRALLRFKNDSGKPIYAFIESASNKEYYIVSVADTISMPKAGTIELNGLKSEQYFLKGFLDKVGVEADFIKMGKYKSAPEMFTNSEPSAENTEQITSLLANFYDEISRAIIHGRNNLSPEKLNTITQTGFFSADKAKQFELIDRVEYFSDLKDEILKSKISDIRWKIDFPSYVNTKFYDDVWGSKEKIALVVLDGDIISGTSRNGGLFSKKSIGSDTLVDILSSIRNDASIKGVVLRINSPGGSGLASDIIWNEIKLLKEEKKYVTVSLGNVAASGGYYLAVGGDEIVANHMTITGSIGVFAGKFSLKKLYAMLGVNKTVVKTHKKAAIFSETDKFSDEERVLLKEHLSEFYQLFLERVSRSRSSLTMKQIEENAGGRVYSGDLAKSKGMVDYLGGLMLALELTRLKANIETNNMEVVLYPHESTSLLALGDMTQLALPYTIRKAMQLLTRNENLQEDKIFFMMPYELEIK